MARLLWYRDTTGDNLRFSATCPDLDSLSAILKPLIQQRWTMNKIKTQATNRLRHLLASTFPEGETKYFTYLVKLLHVFPSPASIIDAGEKKLIKAGIRKAIADQLLETARETVRIPAQKYERIIQIMALQRLDAELQVEILFHCLKTRQKYEYQRNRN